ncbi:MAG: hypothetical protein Q7S99_03095 [Parvibaculum sp.]|nr:hypothetical protein [Parvibaculum sp.]
MSRMKIITQRDEILSVRKRFFEQYKNHSDNYVFWLSDPKSIGESRAELSALNLETCSVADVDAAIGRAGWIENKCDICREDSPILIQLGDEPDFESRWQTLCASCLKKALDTLTSAAAVAALNLEIEK